MPEWEDTHNVAGFEWCIRDHFREDDVFDQLWMSLMALAIGETLQGCLGVRVVSKTASGRMTRKLEAWMDATADAESTHAFLRTEIINREWRMDSHSVPIPAAVEQSRRRPWFHRHHRE